MQIMELDGTNTGPWSEHFRGGYGSWPVGASCEVHCHEGAIDVFVFLEGECEMQVEGETRRLHAGQAVFVGPGERHKLTAVGDRPLVMFSLVYPNLKPSHTFYKLDGTPVHWDPPPATTPEEAQRRSYGPSCEEIEQL